MIKNILALDFFESLNKRSKQTFYFFNKGRKIRTDFVLLTSSHSYTVPVVVHVLSKEKKDIFKATN